MAVPKEISRRISITRYFLVIGIVVLHTPPLTPLNQLDGSAFEWFRAFLTHGVFRALIPVLTSISGYLLFASGLHLSPAKLIGKKTASILVPLVLWNLPLAVVLYVVQRYGWMSYDFRASLHPVTLHAWVDAVVGLDDYPVNYPLNFLRDLFVLALLSPLFWQLLKRAPYIGLGVVFTVFLFNLDGPVVLFDAMMVTFYVGALAATQRWDLTRLDRYAVALLLLFVLICFTSIAFGIPNKKFLRLLTLPLVWPAMSLLVDTRFGDLLLRHAKHSFFTFLSHSVLLLASWLVYRRLPSGSLPYPLFWLIAPASIVVLGVVLDRQFKRWTPRLAAIMLGNR